MSKKKDLPAMPFYFGDWLKDPGIRALDWDVRMVWMEMLGFMWESERRGYLVLNGKEIDRKTLQKMLGCDRKLIIKSLLQLEKYSIFSRTKEGIIYSRRMAEDEEKRQNKRKAGKIGMQNRYNKKENSVITKPLTNAESETESEETVIRKGVGNLDSKVTAFLQSFGSGINRAGVEMFFSREIADPDFVITRAKDYIEFCDKTGRKRKDPLNWLREGLFETDWKKEIPDTDNLDDLFPEP